MLAALAQKLLTPEVTGVATISPLRSLLVLVFMQFPRP